MNKYRISLIVYDFDGTLVDTLFDIADAVNLSLNELGLRALSRETIRKYVGKGVEKLMDQGAWDITSVREFSDVKSEARALGKTVHFGRDFPLCHKKNAELSPEHW